MLCTRRERTPRSSWEDSEPHGGRGLPRPPRLWWGVGSDCVTDVWEGKAQPGLLGLVTAVDAHRSHHKGALYSGVGAPPRSVLRPSQFLTQGRRPARVPGEGGGDFATSRGAFRVSAARGLGSWPGPVRAALLGSTSPPCLVRGCPLRLGMGPPEIPMVFTAAVAAESLGKA